MFSLQHLAEWPPTVVTIKDVSLIDELLRLEWNANRENLEFLAEASPDLTPGSWHTVMPESQWWITENSWSAAEISAARRFFRVRARPQ